jgi:hypothetical protein
MLTRILSIAGPLWVYMTVATLVYGIARQRKRFEWIALAPALAGLLASVLFLPAAHRLFWDEDLYINIASNLTHVPVHQITVMGGPDDIQVSSYYKEPAGWPVLLSFAFLAAGRSEAVAFWFARLLYALAIAVVYHLARELLPTRRQALTAAILFGATPVCFWFSLSTGTDIPAALLVVLGMWGLTTGNGALAAAGLALAAQTRMEPLVLIPLVWLSRRVPFKWKIVAGALISVQLVHLAWVRSIAPGLAQAEGVSSGITLGYLIRNLRDNLEYVLNPLAFPVMVSVLAVAAVLARRSIASLDRRNLYLWTGGLLAVYLPFYAGSFDMNPRYCIQILAPMTILAASFANRPLWIAALLISAMIPATQRYERSSFLEALEADHRLSLQFASRIDADDLVVSDQQEIFVNQGRRGMNSVFASTRKTTLEGEIRKRHKTFYHSGVRTDAENSDERRADQWVKSNFELHLIDSHQVGGFQIAFYELLLQRIDTEAR